MVDVTFRQPRGVGGIVGAEALGPQTLRVTRPVDVWFDGGRVYELRLPATLADLERLELDPRGRFPDGLRGDNVWPR